VTTEQQQQGVRLSTLLFQKAAFMQHYNLDDEFEQTKMFIFSTDLDTQYEPGKLFFKYAHRYYHAALHPFLEKGLMCIWGSDPFEYHEYS